MKSGQMLEHFYGCEGVQHFKSDTRTFKNVCFARLGPEYFDRKQERENYTHFDWWWHFNHLSLVGQPELTYDYVRKLVDYLKDPYIELIRTGEVKFIIRFHFNKERPSFRQFYMGAATLLRYGMEFPVAVLVWDWLRQQGVPEQLAYIMCGSFTHPKYWDGGIRGGGHAAEVCYPSDKTPPLAKLEYSLAECHERSMNRYSGTSTKAFIPESFTVSYAPYPLKFPESEAVVQKWVNGNMANAEVKRPFAKTYVLTERETLEFA